MSTTLPPASPAVGLALSLTPAAIVQVKDFAAKMPEASGKFLRVFVQGGGCSGFQYGFTFDDAKEDDYRVPAEDLTVLVDPMSAAKLNGSTVTWVEDMRGAGFSVENPNATSGCGCGSTCA